jgi:AAA domain
MLQSPSCEAVRGFVQQSYRWTVARNHTPNPYDHITDHYTQRIQMHTCARFDRVCMFDTGKEVVAGTSLVNRVEAEMVMRLYGALTAAAPQLRDRPAIGIISPYKAQVPFHQLTMQGPCF